MLIKLLITTFTILHQENMQIAKMIASMGGNKSLEKVNEWIKSADEHAQNKLNEVLNGDNEVDDGK